jgi:hypothetical protein
MRTCFSSERRAALLQCARLRGSLPYRLNHSPPPPQKKMTTPLLLRAAVRSSARCALRIAPPASSAMGKRHLSGGGAPGPAALASKQKTNSPYGLGDHRSDAEDLIKQVPVIEVDGDLAMCSGGGTFAAASCGKARNLVCLFHVTNISLFLGYAGAGALGHPLEYIKLAKSRDEPETCKYCGLRYQSKPHHH